MTENEQKKLLEALAKGIGPEAARDHALFHLMLASGIRLGSTVALDLEDLDLDKSEIRLRTAKGDAPDTVFLGQAICDHLRRHVEGRRPGAIFTAASGGRLSKRHVQRRFAQWIKKAGVTANVSTHSMRHRFAQRIYSKTGDLLLTKEALRHKSIASTLVYARLDVSRLRAAL